MRWLAVIVVAGCYGPNPQAGSTCDELHPCPDPLVCSPATQTCETTASQLDAGGDGPESTPDACEAMCGMGPANDGPGGAIDITAGGTFTADLGAAHDDSARPVSGGGPPCGGTGGKDVFYKIHLGADEAYYLDTFGSNFDTVIRVYHGACISGAAPNSVRCHNDQCTTTQSQGIWDLTAGDSCVVVDQNTNAETNGSLVLHVERGHRTGSLRAATNTGDTTGSSDQTIGTCASTGNDDGYYFTLCPGVSATVTATTCNATTLWDTALYAKGPGGAELACNDDDAACTANNGASTISFTANGAHLFWIIVDAGGAGTLGPYELDSTMN